MLLQITTTHYPTSGKGQGKPNARLTYFQKDLLPQRITLFSLCEKSTQTLLKTELQVLSPFIPHSMQATSEQRAPSFTAVHNLQSSWYADRLKILFVKFFVNHYHTAEQLQFQFHKLLQSQQVIKTREALYTFHLLISQKL